MSFLDMPLFYAENCLKKAQLKHFSLSFVEKGDIM